MVTSKTALQRPQWQSRQAIWMPRNSGQWPSLQPLKASIRLIDDSQACRPLPTRRCRHGTRTNSAYPSIHRKTSFRPRGSQFEHHNSRERFTKVETPYLRFCSWRWLLHWMWQLARIRLLTSCEDGFGEWHTSHCCNFQVCRPVTLWSFYADRYLIATASVPRAS